jgi:hypothetical protein
MSVNLPDIPSPPSSPVTVPPVTVPPITVVPVTVPPITVPPITVPPITVPPVSVPPVTVPPITVPLIFQEVGFTKDISAIIQIYNDETDPSLNIILQEIKTYADNIQNANFQGKGTINDYITLFTTSLKLAKQNNLIIDISGFQDLGNVADELSAVFQQYILKLQSTNTIYDLAFLTSIASSLEKINNLATIFLNFKQTILQTSIIEIPKSLKDTKIILQNLLPEINNAFLYINHFINPITDISFATLSVKDQAQILEKWENTCVNDVNIIHSKNIDISFIEQANIIMENTANLLKNSTVVFKGKISTFL